MRVTDAQVAADLHEAELSIGAGYANSDPEVSVAQFADVLRDLLDAREALAEQWEAAHFDHCTRLVNGKCPHETGQGIHGCKWPLPAALAGVDTSETTP